MHINYKIWSVAIEPVAVYIIYCHDYHIIWYTVILHRKKNYPRSIPSSFKKEPHLAIIVGTMP